MKTWKIKPQEAIVILDAASRESGYSKSRIFIEAGLRINTDKPKAENINVALISDDPDWNDTDLADFVDFATVRKGVTLTDNGTAIVDFYIYTKGDDGQLQSNITVHYSDGAIIKIEGTKAVRYIISK